VDDLTAFLRAQLNEDEAAAEATLPLHLRVGRFRGKEIPRWRITKSGAGIIDEDGGTLRAQQIFPAEADHVIRHDPARVLREVDAKRAIVDDLAEFIRWGARKGLDYQDGVDACERTLKRLALPYADRPGYREGWRP
jgi:hypothetical protein